VVEMPGAERLQIACDSGVRGNLRPSCRWLNDAATATASTTVVLLIGIALEYMAEAVEGAVPFVV